MTPNPPKSVEDLCAVPVRPEAASEIPPPNRPDLVDPILIPRPPRYYSAKEAYELVSRMPLPAVKNLGEGLSPEYYDKKTDTMVLPPAWPDELHEAPMQVVRAAREFLTAMEKGTPKELNDRLDGPVAQQVNIGLKRFVIEAPSKAETGEEWEKLFGAAPELPEPAG